MSIPPAPGSKLELAVTLLYGFASIVQYICGVLVTRQAYKMPAKNSAAYAAWRFNLLTSAFGVVGLAVGLVALCYAARVSHFAYFALDTKVVAAWQLIVSIGTGAGFVWWGIRKSQRSHALQ